MKELTHHLTIINGGNSDDAITALSITTAATLVGILIMCCMLRHHPAINDFDWFN